MVNAQSSGKRHSAVEPPWPECVLTLSLAVVRRARVPGPERCGGR